MTPGYIAAVALSSLVGGTICHFKGHVLGSNDYQYDVLLRNVPGCTRCGKVMLAEWLERKFSALSPS